MLSIIAIFKYQPQKSPYTALCTYLKPRNNFESVASRQFQNYSCFE